MSCPRDRKPKVHYFLLSNAPTERDTYVPQKNDFEYLFHEVFCGESKCTHPLFQPRVLQVGIHKTVPNRATIKFEILLKDTFLVDRGTFLVHRVT